MSVQLPNVVKYSTNVLVIFFMTIPQLVLAEGEADCRRLGTYITNAQQSAHYMQINQFSPEIHPSAVEYNNAVNEVVGYINNIEREGGEKRIACAVIAASRARKILAYAKNENVAAATALQENLAKVKECIVEQHPLLETADQIYKYESDAYYICNGVLKP